MAKILFIDDDADFIDAAKTLLEIKGHKIISASNGEHGFVKAKSEKPDLIFLDVMMAHDTEGIETARKLREDPATKTIPVTIVTGIKKAKTLSFRLEPDQDWLPVRSVLEKPVKPEDLLNQIKRTLGE